MSTQPNGHRPVNRFAADDSGVIVVIGSGAGGGTLANELCQKGAKGRPDRSRPAPPARGLHQRRVGLTQPARLAGRAHDVWLVADSRGIPEPAGLDLQDGRRHDRSLGRLLPALQGMGVPDPTTSCPPTTAVQAGQGTLL